MLAPLIQSILMTTLFLLFAGWFMELVGSRLRRPATSSGPVAGSGSLDRLDRSHSIVRAHSTDVTVEVHGNKGAAIWTK